MDKNMQTIMQKRIQRTMEALGRNRMEACYAERAADVPGLVESLLREMCIRDRYGNGVPPQLCRPFG